MIVYPAHDAVPHGEALAPAGLNGTPAAQELAVVDQHVAAMGTHQHVGYVGLGGFAGGQEIAEVFHHAVPEAQVICVIGADQLAPVAHIVALVPVPRVAAKALHRHVAAGDVEIIGVGEAAVMGQLEGAALDGDGHVQQGAPAHLHVPGDILGVIADTQIPWHAVADIQEQGAVHERAVAVHGHRFGIVGGIGIARFHPAVAHTDHDIRILPLDHEGDQLVGVVLQKINVQALGVQLVDLGGRKRHVVLFLVGAHGEHDAFVLDGRLDQEGGSRPVHVGFDVHVVPNAV